MILVITLIGLILTLWFRSNAWLEYTKLLGCNFLSKYKEYEAEVSKYPLLEYHDFLKQNYNCFLIRLITCPVCLSTWLGLLFGFVTHIYLFPVYSIFGLILYLIINKLLG